MTRDLMGILLLSVAGALFLISWYLIRAERIKKGEWLEWPPSLTWRLAGTFSSIAMLLGVLGVLVMGGDAPLPWWSIVIIGHIALWVGAFWLEWSRPKENLAVPEGPAGSPPAEDVGMRDAD